MYFLGLKAIALKNSITLFEIMVTRFQIFVTMMGLCVEAFYRNKQKISANV